MWKYRYYENDSLVINREEEPEQLIKGNSKGLTIEKIKKEPRQAKTVEQHLMGSSDELMDLFNRINEEIMSISSEVERYTTNAEILYKTSRNFACLAIQRQNNCLRFLLRTTNDAIIDKKNLTTHIPKTHGYGNITRQLIVSPLDEKFGKYSVADVMDLINQAYDTTQ